MKRLLSSPLALVALLAPSLQLLASKASAHEAYVLSSEQVRRDKLNHSVQIWQALEGRGDLITFLVMGGGITASLAAALYLKLTPTFRRLGALINRTSRWAPDLIRVVFGASLLFSAAHHSLFGPELPVASLPQGELLEVGMYVIGTALIIGLFARVAAALSILLWLVGFIDTGPYLFTYLNYLGEGVALLFMPRQWLSLDHLLAKKHKKKTHAHHLKASDRYGIPIARIAFALSLIFTAVQVKLLHPAVSLHVISEYHLTRYFPFDPLFIVFGAALTEILIGTLYLLGLLQRVTTFIFATFILLSLFYFREAVWPHYLLLGLAAGIFLHQSDRYSLDAYLDRRFGRK